MLFIKIILLFEDLNLTENDIMRFKTYSKLLHNRFDTIMTPHIATFQYDSPDKIKFIKMSRILVTYEKCIICENTDYLRNIINDAIMFLLSIKCIRQNNVSRILQKIYILDKDNLIKLTG